jgi:hypothetical protein
MLFVPARLRGPGLACLVYLACAVLALVGCGGAANVPLASAGGEPDGGGATQEGDSGVANKGTGDGGSGDGAAAPAGDGGGTSPGSDGDAPAGDAGSTPSGDGGWWSPTSGAPIHFHWQLSSTFALPADVVSGQGQIVYDIDGETNDAATVAALHELGVNVKVVCYVDVGTYENYRSDAASFPASVLGSSNGWPGEQWLDVRQQSILLPIMKARFQSWCVDKGFDAIEPDNLDGWQNSSGFPLTESENVSYDLAIAALGHSLGLSVGQKNVPSNVATMEPSFDWALDEQCFEYSECDGYQTSFLAKGKAVWDVEYNTSPDCAQSGTWHMNAQMRDLDLVAPGASAYVYQPCVPDSQATW